MGANNENIPYMKKYLHHATELEKYLYIWNTSLNKINASILNVQKEKQSTANAINSADMQYSAVDHNVESEYRNNKRSVNKTAFIYIPLIIIFILFSYAAPLLLGAFDSMGESGGFAAGFKSYIDSNLGGMGFFMVILIAALIIVALCTVGIIVISNFKRKKKNRYWKKESENRKNAILNQRKQREAQLTVCQSKEQALYKQRAAILNNLRETQEKLNELYSENILPQKYRNFVAVATMYEYLSTGRCTAIKGHGGMIDTYEYDCKMGMIVANLVQINQKLSVMAQNQRILFDELQNANSHLNNISDSISSIEKHAESIDRNTAISAVADQQTAEIMRWTQYERPAGW